MTNSYLTHLTQCIKFKSPSSPCGPWWPLMALVPSDEDVPHIRIHLHIRRQVRIITSMLMGSQISGKYEWKNDEKRWKTHGFFGFTWFFKSKNQQFLFVRWRWCFGLVSERKWNAGSCGSVCRSMVFSGQTGICRSEIMASRLGSLHLSCGCWCGCCYFVGWEDTCIMYVYKHIWLYRCFPKEQHVFLRLVAQIKLKTTWHTPAGCPFPCISCSTTPPRCSCCSCRDGWWGPRTSSSSSSSIQGEATNW